MEVKIDIERKEINRHKSFGYETDSNSSMKLCIENITVGKRKNFSASLVKAGRQREY